MPRTSSRRSKAAVESDDDEDRKPSADDVEDRKPAADDLVDDDDDGDAAEAGMFSSQIPELSQDIQPVKANERSNLLKMSEEAREKAINDLSRLILFKALANEPIDRTKCIKEAGVNESKISSAVFEEVSIRLRNCFDFELKRIPTFFEKQKNLPVKYKDRFFVINAIEDDDHGTHSKAIHAVHENSAIEHGLLMVILAITFCKGHARSDGSRWIVDKDLYSLLNRVDENIPAEPPAQGTKRRASTQSSARFDGGGGVAQTPDVDVLLEEFVRRDYLLKEKASDEHLNLCGNAEETSMFYAMGPRSAMEIGRRQIVYFAAEVLDERPDETMLNDIKASEAADEGSQELAYSVH